MAENGDTAAEAHQVFKLFKNRPSPFNPATTIGYVLYETGKVSLKIYDTLGRDIATLAEGYKNAGSHEVVWDGTDNNGIQVSSGVYLYRFRAGETEEARSMMLVR